MLTIINDLASQTLTKELHMTRPALRNATRQMQSLAVSAEKRDIRPCSFARFGKVTFDI